MFLIQAILAIIALVIARQVVATRPPFTVF